MGHQVHRFTKGLLATSCLLLSGAIGCSPSTEHFPSEPLFDALNELSAEQSESIDDVLEQLFGTPEEPSLPQEIVSSGLLVLEQLKQAAGPVISHEVGVTQGLYRRHCARCHGIAGDGRGPTALYQYPYPRDFTHGVFKWKRTYRDAKPTDEDLQRVIRRGVPGSAMPSFQLLADEELAALRQYLVYLSIRGELRRQLVWNAADEMPVDEVYDPMDAAEMSAIKANLLQPIVDAWASADGLVVETDIDLARVIADSDSADRGRELFHSDRAGCAKCHGENGMGDTALLGSPVEDYDDWSRERIESRSLADSSRSFPARRALRPSLIGAKARGGAEAIDLFRRAHQGIAGSPMGAVGPRRPGESAALTDEEIAQLVAYLLTLLEAEEEA